MIYVLRQQQNLRIDLATAWNFFSDPANLSLITPPEMKFRILTKDTAGMYAGQMIHYRIKLMPLVGFEWLTEITHVADGVRFVDEQRTGPYAIWHHEHHFRTVAGGVEMTDVIHYKLPMGFLGNLANNLIVAPKLKKIFDYRREVLKQKFGAL